MLKCYQINIEVLYLFDVIYSTSMWISDNLCCLCHTYIEKFYRVFHRFGQAKLGNASLVLGSFQFPILPQLPQKINVCSI